MSRPLIEAAGDLHGRSIPEWIGATPDTQVPDKIKLRVLLRHERTCHRTGEKIRPGDAWDCDHIIALVNGGENRERNLAPIKHGAPHVEKTAEDRDEADKIRRIREKHYGLKKKSRAWGKRFGWRKTGCGEAVASPSPDTTAGAGPMKVAALFVETDGVYYGLPDVEPWDRWRDAREYAGPYPVVAHPPCERWGRMWFGSPLKPDKQKYRLGDDGGCFHMALVAVRNFGGVLEHPEGSRAWEWFGLSRPPRLGGWVRADFVGGWTCYVEQGHYGHAGRKATWLYANGVELPSLKWGHSGQRLDPIAVERHGYERARRSGITGRIGGKFKKAHRGRSPIEFRDLLLGIARSAITAREVA